MVLPDLLDSEEKPAVAAAEVSFLEPPQITFDLGRAALTYSFIINLFLYI